MTPRADGSNPNPRERILTSARRLFLEHGFIGTTIAAIARDAGVALQTIYRCYASKVGILAAVQDQAVAGDLNDVPLLQRPWVARLGQQPTDEAVRAVVETLTAATARVAPVHQVIVQAASDPAVRTLLDSLHAQRITTCRDVAAALVPAATSVTLADEIYLLIGPETYQLLVHRRGWPEEKWRSWVEQRLLAACADADARTGP